MGRRSIAVPRRGAEPLELDIEEQAVEGIGFQVWQAAHVLCDYLLSQLSADGSAAQPLPCGSEGRHGGVVNGRRRKRVLELGAGPGLVGIACAHIAGLEVTLTDVAEVLPLTARNVERNPVLDPSVGALATCELPWGSDIRSRWPRGHFDFIVGSDVTYFTHLHEPLLITLLQLADPSTEVLLAHVQRKEQFDGWVERFRLYFDVAEVALQAPPGVGHQCEEDAPIAVFALRLHTLPAADELDRLLQRASDDDPEALLARLALLERDLDTIETEQEENLQ